MIMALLVLQTRLRNLASLFSKQELLVNDLSCGSFDKKSAYNQSFSHLSLKQLSLKPRLTFPLQDESSAHLVCIWTQLFFCRLFIFPHPPS